VSIELTSCSRVLHEKLKFVQITNKFPAFYGTRRFITFYCVHTSPALALTLSQMNSVHTIPSDFFMIHFNIIISYMPRSLKLSFSVKFYEQNLVCMSLLSHPLPHPSHRPWFHNTNNIWRGAQIISFSLCNFLQYIRHTEVANFIGFNILKKGFGTKNWSWSN
jgi:hypothetical protein